MIQVENLKKNYGGRTVLQVPELTIEKGERFGLVGNNGAGKTTFFRLILDLIRADDGRVLSYGKDVSKTESWKSYTAAYLDEGFLIDYLTPAEYFLFVAQLNGLSRGDVEQFIGNELHAFFGTDILQEKSYLRELSKGNQKKVGIAAALMVDPEVLLLDEPFSNLDPTSQFQLKEILKKFQETKKRCVLISSHDLNHVTEVCERIVVLHEGEIVHDLETNENTLKELEAFFAVKGD
ncbi:ABC transporter ATP-binding protein [Candidatus Sulfidibacterium hydrothermale]|uniref:ABC transporter ATP-binding protein n=1 Tax=Candidatus Sulfidibacterium hydrothermale TaxID=2875962 RepID=UPI001F0B5058|nr:ABC transporter ATP-binding protein [Candidatus Sulfidibacterium hydrothermale]UBM61061.1 ABC transporter ATP-binding protein [Candidatus Sulfidibacterium hydrothermale]